MEKNLDQDINIIVGQTAWSILRDTKWLESWEKADGNYLKDEEIEWLMQSLRTLERVLGLEEDE